MRKLWKRILICGCILILVWSIGLLRDRRLLRQELIRFHVVANSDSAEDQARKLLVRDALQDCIRDDLAQLTDVDAAKTYLRDNLPKLRQIALGVLRDAGSTDMVEIVLGKEPFDTRVYDTFTLPAGIYESLRVVIGEGEGHNWWCVTFPNLCLPAASESFASRAAGAGFSAELSQTLQQKPGYELRFLFLDVLGHLENTLYSPE